MWRNFRLTNNKIYKKVKSYDAFGHPITVNYKGQEAYTTGVGCLLTLALTIICIFYFVDLYSKVTERKEPIFSQFTLPNSRPADDPYMMSENYGQIYIGLQKSTDFTTGAKVLNFVPFDPEYMNFKIDFFNQVELT